MSNNCRTLLAAIGICVCAVALVTCEDQGVQPVETEGGTNAGQMFNKSDRDRTETTLSAGSRYSSAGVKQHHSVLKPTLRAHLEDLARDSKTLRRADASRRKVWGSSIDVNGTVDHHIYYARYSVANHFDWLQNYSRSPCHIQGFARLASGGVVFNYNRIGGDGVFGVGRDCYPLILRFSPNNHKFSPVLLWTDYTNSDYRHYAYVPMDRLDNRGRQWHSGGMQAIGDYLAMPIDEAEKGPSRIVILDMTKNPPRLVHNLQLNNKPRPTRAEAVAITQMADGRFLLIAGQKQGRHAVAWRSTGTDMERTKWNLIDNSITIYYGNILGGKFNFNNLALVQAQPDRWNRPVAGKQQTYLLGLSNYPARTGGNTESDDTSVIVPYRVNIVYNRFTKREEVAIVQPHKSMEDGWMYRKAYKLDEGCGFFDVCPNFGAGGTVHVRGPYAMTVYATEHWPHGDDLDRLEWESKTKSYSTGSDPGGGDDGCRFCF